MNTRFILLGLFLLFFANAWCAKAESDFTGFDPTSPYNKWDDSVTYSHYSYYKKNIRGNFDRDNRTYSAHFEVEPEDYISAYIDSKLTSSMLGAEELYDFSVRIDVSAPIDRIKISLGASIPSYEIWEYTAYFSDYYYLYEGSNYIYFSEIPIPNTHGETFQLSFTLENLTGSIDFSISDITWIKHSENDITAPDHGGCDIYDEFNYNGLLYHVMSYGKHEAALCKQTTIAGNTVKVERTITYMGESYNVTSIDDMALSKLKFEKLYLPRTVNDIGINLLWYTNGLKEIHCGNPEPPKPTSLGLQYNNVKVYVPVGSKQNYANTYPWYQYEIYEEYSEENGFECCEAPEITYADNTLHFYSPTPGATYLYNIIVDDSTPELISSDGTVPLTATYKIIAYAKAEYYAISKASVATLCWLDADPQLSNPIIAQSAPVLIKYNGNTILLEGAMNVSHVEFYSISGAYLGSEPVQNGQASYKTNEPIVLIKIGDKTLKVAR